MDRAGKIDSVQSERATRRYGRLHVKTFASSAKMGIAAADDFASELCRRLDTQEQVRVAFASAPSQSEFHEALASRTDLDWSRVEAFHIDEYIGLPESAPQRFANWLKQSLFDRCPFGAVHLIEPQGTAETSVRNYASLLNAAPVDIACLGIGTNCHLAFNDPQVADFSHPDDVGIVELDDICRQQQVDDGCFESISAVPKRAVTLTIPMLLSAKRIHCIVPGRAKRHAVWRTLHDPIAEVCPSTILRTHRNCDLYLDQDSDPHFQDFSE